MRAGRLSLSAVGVHARGSWELRCGWRGALDGFASRLARAASPPLPPHPPPPLPCSADEVLVSGEDDIAARAMEITGGW